MVNITTQNTISKKYNIIQKGDRKGLSLIEFLFILCSAVFYINFEIQAHFQLIAPFIALTYIIFCFVVESEYGRLIAKFLLILVLFVMLYMVLTDSESIGNVANRGMKRFYAKFSQYLLVFYPIFLFYRTNRLATKKQIYMIIVIVLFNALILIQTALKIIEVNATVFHSMNAEVLEEAGVDIQGYSFVYAFTFLVLTCVLCYKYQEKIWLKLLFGGIGLYSAYFLFKSQFALSIVTTFCSLIYLYFTTTKNRNRRIGVTIMIIMIILSLPLLIKLTISLSDSVLLNQRLEEIYDTLTCGSQNSEESDLWARMELYGNCIVAFLHSPILGNRSLDFNGHSTFLCVLADLGIIGGCIIYKLFKNAFAFMKIRLEKKYLYFTPLVCQVILMGLTNPIHSTPSIFVMLWFLCPLLIIQFVKE